MDILKDDFGINAIRFRVWVNPSGGWSGKNDKEGLCCMGRQPQGGTSRNLQSTIRWFICEDGSRLVGCTIKA